MREVSVIDGKCRRRFLGVRGNALSEVVCSAASLVQGRPSVEAEAPQAEPDFVQQTGREGGGQRGGIHIRVAFKLAVESIWIGADAGLSGVAPVLFAAQRSIEFVTRADLVIDADIVLIPVLSFVGSRAAVDTRYATQPT